MTQDFDPDLRPKKIVIQYRDGSSETVTVVSFDVVPGWLKLDLSDTKMRFINEDLIKEFTVE